MLQIAKSFLDQIKQRPVVAFGEMTGENLLVGNDLDDPRLSVDLVIPKRFTQRQPMSDGQGHEK